MLPPPRSPQTLLALSQSHLLRQFSGLAVNKQELRLSAFLVLLCA